MRWAGWGGSSRRLVADNASVEELFDLCDERGRPLGLTKPRSQVHRDGDWHRSFHCWLVDRRDDGDVAILLQLRPPDKDTSPGLWDVSVGGHYSAGEGIEGGVRELREELGLRAEANELVQAGWRHGVVKEPGVHDREVQDVFFLHRPIQVRDLRPDGTEVPAVAVVSGQHLLQLAARRISVVEAAGGRVGPNRAVLPEPIFLAADRLVPRENRYYEKAVRFGRALVNGYAAGLRRRWW